MRVGLFWWKEKPGGFDGRVRGLHRDLCSRQVAPDEDVQMRNLGERSGHG